jgi:hypothetical protein
MKNLVNMFKDIGKRIDEIVEVNHAALSGVENRLTRIEALLTPLHDLLAGQQPTKDAYSVEDVAEILGKRPYTVREWCRLGRVNAKKRPYGRGCTTEWEISAEELKRIKSHGLLPVPRRY